MDLIGYNEHHLTNWEALAELEREEEALAGGLMGFLGVTLAVSIFSVGSLGFLSVFSTKAAFDRLQKMNRIMRVMEALLEEFGDEIVIIPRVPVPNEQPIDLFVRFPGRALFLISIRSRGKQKVVFKENKELLYLRQKRKRGGLSKWKPDPLTELSDYKYWLKNNRRELGLSSRESNRPIAKVLVLAGETDIEVHPEHLYKQTGDQKFLWINTQGSTALIREAEVVDFTKAYLAQEEQKKLQKVSTKAR
ncbi:MAG: hypothetical protein SAL07_25480 [Oscillatoria sp. PMC 1051.18]|nr:hypothetical protein [Oscillatoria sp. PMC 1050.18]MEC5033260.1 hypothetical protein [Oscillatoria sp. PMC 1051.18]